MVDNLKKGKYKIYGGVAGFFAIIILGFVFVVFPIIREIVYNSDEIQKKKIDNEINRKGIEKIPEMEKLVALFEQKTSSLEVILKKGKEIEFFRHVENLASNTGNQVELKISEVKNTTTKKDGKTKDTSFLGTLPYKNFILMELTLTGNYDGLIKFLGKLEKNEKYVNAVGIDISKMEIRETSSNVFSSDKKNDTEIKKKEILQSIIKLAVYIEEEKK